MLFPRSIFFENHFNPASLDQQSFKLVIDAGSHFGLPEVRTYTLHSEIKSYQINITSFGCDIYRENIANAGFSFCISEKIAAGFGIAMLNYWVKDYCNCFSYSLKIGGIYRHNPLEINAWAHNVNLPRFSNIDYIPLNYSVKISYRTKDYLSLLFAIRGLESDLPFFNLGLSFSPYKIITFGAGINTDPVYLEYMLQLSLGNVALNYAGSNHRFLGLSHCLGVSFVP